MRFTANDIRTRTQLTKLLVKIDENPEKCRQIGVEDSSRFRSDNSDDNADNMTSDEEKGVDEYADFAWNDFSDGWTI